MHSGFSEDDAWAALMSVQRDAGAGIALFDPEDRLRYANDWFRDAFGVDPMLAPTWEAMMRGCHALRRGVVIDTDDIEAWLADVRRRYRRRRLRSFASDLRDGRWVWVTESLRPDGWLHMVVVDVSPLKAAETAATRARDEAVQIAHSDPLTDLPNRRALETELQTLLEESRAMRWPLTAVVADLDHFKAINDRYGHAVGDTVLCDFADRLRRGHRPRDVSGRLGGEEFVLLLPNTGLPGALQVLARLRRQPQAGDLPAYDFSAGCALARADDTVGSLIERADEALYRAKRDGRGRDALAVPE